jgi:hypothetical protein
MLLYFCSFFTSKAWCMYVSKMDLVFSFDGMIGTWDEVFKWCHRDW